MGKAILFVDSRVQDWRALLSATASEVDLVILDASRDGIDQIVDALRDKLEVPAIHILSHGGPGTLYLGSSVLNIATLQGYAGELRQIGSALSSDADILLYGCNVASSEIGQQFIQSLSGLTRADVAASTNPTGGVASGSDWVLEASTGTIEALAPLNAGGQADYSYALAAAGTLDPAFGDDGIVTTALGTFSDQINTMALQADGKIVVAGSSNSDSRFNVGDDFALARYNPDGSLDSTFDGDGKLITEIGDNNDVVASLALQTDGKILVAGYSVNSNRNRDFALARYNSDGSLDTSFAGDGKVTTAIGTDNDEIRGIVLQRDGKIVAAGYSWAGSTTHFALARYNTDGSLDNTFDVDGKLTTAIGVNGDVASSIVLQADGKIVVAGHTFPTSGVHFALARYNPDGSLDTAFDGDGKVTTAIAGDRQSQISSVVLQPDGKIVAAGSADDDLALARYNNDGSLDTSFDGDGKVITAIGTGSEAINSVALQGDGKIVVAGYDSTDVQGSNVNFALARYNPDGSLDTTFDADGRLTIEVSPRSDVANSVLVQSDGAIVAAGYSATAANTSNNFALIRVLGGEPTDGHTIERVSVASDGTQANKGSGQPAISSDGRYVAFFSEASNLVANDSNGVADIFVHDRVTNITERVSVSSAGAQATGDLASLSTSISADGRYVAFSSHASNLVAGDTNASADVFVHDRVTHVTERVSVADDGAQANGGSKAPSINADGRYIAFRSEASNLVAVDTNNRADTFVYDRTTKTIERVSLASDGTQAQVQRNGDDYDIPPSISADGRYVTFSSVATNLVANDINAAEDIFVYDRVTRDIRSLTASLTLGQGSSNESTTPVISADGHYVAFVGPRNGFANDPAPSNGAHDVYVYDLLTNTLESVSGGLSIPFPLPDSLSPAISGDGRYITFGSWASDLVSGDTNGKPDTFLYDRVTGITERIITSDGVPGDAPVRSSISADGRFVAGESSASNLVPGDTNASWDIFVVDRGIRGTPATDIVPGDSSTNVNLAPAQWMPGKIDAIGLDGLAGDKDYYKVSLTRGQLYKFEATAGVRASDTLDGVFIRLRDSDGEFLAVDKAADGESPTFTYAPTTSGTYLLAVSANGAADTWKTKSGDYQVKFSDAGISSTWSFDASNKAVAEDQGSVTFTLTRTNPIGQETVYIKTLQNWNDSRVYNLIDYAGKAGENFTFADGQGQRPVTITFTDDQAPENSETFGLIVQSNPNAAPSSVLTSASFTITDNDSAPPVSGTPPKTIQLFAEDGGKFKTLSDFAVAAYADDQGLASLEQLQIYKGEANTGWLPLSGSLLGLEYPGIRYENDHAAAIVARSEDALVLSFRGTDFSPSSEFAADVLDWGRPQVHYAKFSDLINAVDNYVDAQGIHQVFVTGHSLGSAMVHAYLGSHQDGNGVAYEAMTIATPGYWHFDSDPRTTNFLNEDDPIKEATAASLLSKLGIRALLNIDLGTAIYLGNPGDDNHLLFGDGFDSPGFLDSDVVQHRKALYQEVIAFLSSEIGAANLVRVVRDYDHFVIPFGNSGIDIGDGQKFASGSEAESLVGASRSEVLVAGNDSDNLEGGGGNDLLLGGADDDTYRFNSLRYNGSDTIVDVSGDDTIVLAFGTTLKQITRASQDVVITYGTAALQYSKITISNFDAHHDGNLQIQLGNDAPIPISSLLGSRDHLVDFNAASATAPVIGATLNAFGITGYSAAANLVTKTLQILSSFNPFSGNALADSTFVAAADDGTDGTTQTIDGFRDLIGTALGDHLVGDSQDNILDGGAGDDRIEGGDGDDTLLGEAGNDLVEGGGGSDNIIGGSGEGDDTYDGGDGIDTIVYSSTVQDIFVNLSLAQNQATGGEIGTDQLISIENVIGGSGDDHITGDALQNLIDGALGNDTLSGGDGSDVLNSGLGQDSVDGGAGQDTVDFAQLGAAVWVDLGNVGMEGWTTDTTTLAQGSWRRMADLVNVENVRGGSFADDLRGDANANRLEGGGGDDVVQGGGGDDVVHSGVGLDNVDGGAGQDTVDFAQLAAAVWVSLTYPGVEAWTRDLATLSDGTWRQIADLVSIEDVVGTGYDDYLGGDAGSNVLGYTGGFDVLNGDAGTDTADFSRFNSAVWVSLGHNGPEAWTLDMPTLASGTWRAIADLVNMENVVGSAFSDHLFGNDADNVLSYTGGMDILDGGAGKDAADFSRFGSAVWVDLSHGGPEAWTLDMPTLASGTWRAIADLVNMENVVGSAFSDHLSGNDADNVLSYTGGMDTLDGGAGKDTADFSDFGSAVWVSLTYPGVDAWTRDFATLLDGTWRQIADVSRVENIVGTSYDDYLGGDGGSNVLGYAGGFDALNGDAGTDTADFSRFGSAVWVSLTYPDVEAWTRDLATLSDGTWRQIADLASIEDVLGTSFDDYLGGDAGSNVLGYTGGFDVLNGGGGTDTADFSRFNSAVWIDLGHAGLEAWTMDHPTLSGGPWRAIADLASIENIIGTSAADFLSGDSSANEIAAGAGSDTLAGGAGSDRFVYSNLGDGVDTITDFTRGDGGDILDMRSVLVGYIQGESALSAFVQLTQTGDDTTVSVNGNGAGDDFVSIAILRNVTDVSVDDLLAQGNLILQ